MNQLFKILSFLAAIALFVTASGVQAVKAQPLAAPAASYQAVLGKSLNDQNVEDFLASNHCSSVLQFRLCQAAGMALWIDSNQIARSVYLYPSTTAGFAAYKGPLPFGITARDTMAVVEYKLGQPIVADAPQAGWKPGLPDDGTTPDYIHYNANYRRFGLTIVYNLPSANAKGATIHSIQVSR